MDWSDGMQDAINYIEAHLTEEIRPKTVAGYAACSSSYFQRLFSLWCGVSLGEYIRNRRLTLAGSELQSTGRKVIDVALKYGYETPESFSRAFTRFHGIPPTAAKHRGAQLRSFSRLSVSINLHGGITMDYKISDRAAFFVLEKATQHTCENSANRTTIPAFWTQSHRDGTLDILRKHASVGGQLYGICYGGTKNTDEFTYSIAVECTEDAIVPEGFRKTCIPANTWAIFPCKGAMPQAIQTLWREIGQNFFGASGYSPACELDLEVYTDGDMDADDYESEIRIPVIHQ